MLARNKGWSVVGSVTPGHPQPSHSSGQTGRNRLNQAACLIDQPLGIVGKQVRRHADKDAASNKG